MGCGYCSCDAGCDGYSTCPCLTTCYGHVCYCYNTCYGQTSCSCNNTCHGYVACSCNSTCYGYVACSTCNAKCYLYTPCTCNNMCYADAACLCNSKCYGDTCTCDETCYGYSTCSCNSKCYQEAVCTCDNTCYGYVACTCNNICYGDTGCTCDASCHGYTACTCNNTCYGYLGCSCDVACYGDAACSCDVTCYGYIACACNSECYGYAACTCDNTCHNESPATIVPSLEVSGTMYYGAELHPTTSWATTGHNWRLNPATDNPWEPSELADVASLGYKISTPSSAASASVTQAYVGITWFPPRPILGIHIYKNGVKVESTYFPVWTNTDTPNQVNDLAAILKLTAGDTVQVVVTKTKLDDFILGGATYTYLCVHRMASICV